MPWDKTVPLCCRDLLRLLIKQKTQAQIAIGHAIIAITITTNTPIDTLNIVDIVSWSKVPDPKLLRTHLSLPKWSHLNPEVGQPQSKLLSHSMFAYCASVKFASMKNLKATMRNKRDRFRSILPSTVSGFSLCLLLVNL